MNAYDLSHLTDAQLYELYGRLLAQLDIRGLVVSAAATRNPGTFRVGKEPRPDRGSGNMTAYNVALCKQIADEARMQVGHHPPADKPPPKPIFNHYTE